MADAVTDASLEESLYGDLVATADGQGSILLQSELEAVRAEAQSQSHKLQESEKLTESLVIEIEALKAQNAVLITNISSLFKTAQLELQRKNHEIAELRFNMRKASREELAAPPSKQMGQ